MSTTDIDRYLNPELIEKAAIAAYEEMQRPNWRAPLWGEIDEPGRERFLNAARASLSAALPDIIRQAKAEAIDERAVKLAETSIHTSDVTGQALSRCVDLVEHITKDEVIREAKAEALRDAADGYQTGGWADDLPTGGSRPALIIGMSQRAVAWLRARADRIEHDARCPHPKCPGGGLCCCLPEQGGQP